MTKRDSFAEFLADIRPLIHTQRVSYVDVGAYVGTTYKDFLSAGLKPDEVLLIEPNPTSLSQLESSIKDWQGPKTLNIYNVALSSQKGKITLRAAKDMTRVESGNGINCAHTEQVRDNTFEVDAITLDELANDLLVRHITVLKLDVEGHELNVLEGAAQLLHDEDIDIIYVEAGMSSENRQQCFYRDIEDALLPYGYRVFRFYEQMHEWMEDSPVLRRVNAAFISQAFSKRVPFRLTKELYDCKMELRQKEARLVEAEAKSIALATERDQLKHQTAALQSERDGLRSQIDSFTKSEHDARCEEARHREKLIQENEELRQELRLVRKEASELATQMAVTATDWAAAALRCQELIRGFEEDSAHFEEELKAFHIQVLDAVEAVRSLSTERDVLSAESDALRQEVSRLKKQLDDAHRVSADADSKAAELQQHLESLQLSASREKARRRGLERHLERAHASYRTLVAKFAQQYHSALEEVIRKHQSLMSHFASSYQEREAALLAEAQQEHRRAFEDIERRCKSTLQAYHELASAAHWYEDSYRKLLASRSWRLAAIFRLPRYLYRWLLARLTQRPMYKPPSSPALDSTARALHSTLKKTLTACRSARQRNLSLVANQEPPPPLPLQEPKIVLQLEDFSAPNEAMDIAASAEATFEVAEDFDREEIQDLRFQLARAQEELAFLKQQITEDGDSPSASVMDYQGSLAV